MITLGDILYGAHVGFQAVTRPFRERRAIAALQAVNAANDDGDDSDHSQEAA